ncbi:hypothetical protein AG1IA_09938 [Rhizoctonia solani AG-1 IA]|uniref:Uncharacterized protein n=1 Tax=Thanatephorus cucumeris (strain AG1-IA) TaxID=983506 RepID=L8WH24_THACA|nr:hypothetical protein AG1IA_09938 [Rhizoctonia solani AG-1 IA]
MCGTEINGVQLSANDAVSYTHGEQARKIKAGIKLGEQVTAER